MVYVKSDAVQEVGYGWCLDQQIRQRIIIGSAVMIPAILLSAHLSYL